MDGYCKIIALRNERETLAFAAKLAPYLQAGDVLALRGDLGSGKTSFCRGIIRTLTNTHEVPSPTYTLVQTYEAEKFNIWHFDLYRLEDAHEVWELGIEEALEEGICLIEWPERIDNLLSGAELNIDIVFKDEGRTLQISGSDTWGDRLAKL